VEHNLRPYTSLIFSTESHVSKADILAALPQRFVVDRLVSRYFNSSSPALCKYAHYYFISFANLFLVIIHRPTFQKEVCI
jgi:hypothetical protein